MIPRTKYLLLWLFLLIALSFAADSSLQAHKVQNLSQKAASWMWLGKMVPVVQGSAQLTHPVPVSHDQLLCTDARGQVLLVPQIGKAMIEYRLYASSGELLGGFTLRHDLDRSLPAVEIDAPAQRLFFMEADGRLTTRDYQGTVLWEKPPEPEFEFIYENTYFCHWNPEGKILSAVYSTPSSSGSSVFDTFIRTYDMSGRRLSGHRLPGVQALKLVCNDGNQQKLLLVKSPASTAGARVFLLDRSNRVLWEKETGFREALFLPQNQILLVQKQKILLIEAADGKIVQEFQATEGDRLIADVRLTGPGSIALVTGKAVYLRGKLQYTEPEVTIMESNFTNSRQVSLKGAIYLPQALYFPEAGHVQVGCQNGLYEIDF